MSNENMNEQQNKKSARPRKITYVPIGDEELENTVLPVKKKHKGLKITGIAVAMLAVTAGCAYAGISYYYLRELQSTEWTVPEKLLMRQSRRSQNR